MVQKPICSFQKVLSPHSVCCARKGPPWVCRVRRTGAPRPLAGTFWRSLPGICTLLGPPTCGAHSRLPSPSSSRGGLPQSPRSAPQDSGPPHLSRCCPDLPLQPPLTTSSRLLTNIFGVPPCHLRPDLPKTRLSNVPAPGYQFPSAVGAWGQPVAPLGARQ